MGGGQAMSGQTRGALIVLGMMGQAPFAGVAWQVLQYVEGFRRLGHDAYYVEDTGGWPYDPDQNMVTDDCRYTVAYIARMMAWCGLPDRWAYRAPGGTLSGLSEAQLADRLARADVLVNLTGSTVLGDEHRRVPVRIYLETDPVLPQIEIAKGQQFTIDLLSAHTHHFTYGENFGAPDCGVPIGRFVYHPTRPPVVLDWWATDTRRQTAPQAPFTTITNWKQTGKDVEWNGETYTWSKHHEFLKFIDLPHRTGQPFELALSNADAEAINLLKAKGWGVIEGVALSRDILPYRAYIQASRGEFTVAKDQNIRLRSGWFSDRSACYLAAGRPVITQDTGFGNILPTGRGLFAFRNINDVLAALSAIADDYDGNARAAGEIADAYFSAERVLSSLLARAGLG